MAQGKQGLGQHSGCVLLCLALGGWVSLGVRPAAAAFSVGEYPLNLGARLRLTRTLYGSSTAGHAVSTLVGVNATLKMSSYSVGTSVSFGLNPQEQVFVSNLPITLSRKPWELGEGLTLTPHGSVDLPLSPQQRKQNSYRGGLSAGMGLGYAWHKSKGGWFDVGASLSAGKSFYRSKYTAEDSPNVSQSAQLALNCTRSFGQQEKWLVSVGFGVDLLRSYDTRTRAVLSSSQSLKWQALESVSLLMGHTHAATEMDQTGTRTRVTLFGKNSSRFFTQVNAHF